MIRIDIKPLHYASPARLEYALREAVAGLTEEALIIVQCRSCHAWFAIDSDEVQYDDPPQKQGRFWSIEACQECRKGG